MNNRNETHAPNFWVKQVLYFDNVPVRTLDPDKPADRSLLYELRDRRGHKFEIED